MTTFPVLHERAMFLEEAVAIGDNRLQVKWLVRIDDEQMFVRPRRPGKIDYHWEVSQRGANATAIATHAPGAHVLWWDSTEERWWDDVDQEWVD